MCTLRCRANIYNGLQKAALAVRSVISQLQPLFGEGRQRVVGASMKERIGLSARAALVLCALGAPIVLLASKICIILIMCAFVCSERAQCGVLRLTQSSNAMLTFYMNIYGLRLHAADWVSNIASESKFRNRPCLKLKIQHIIFDFAQNASRYHAQVVLAQRLRNIFWGLSSHDRGPHQP